MSATLSQKKRASQSSSIRLIIQLVFLAITLLIGLRHILPGESAKGGAFDAFCPFGAIETLWSYLETSRTLLTTSLLNFAILIGVAGVSLLAGRAFCGWMCPLGTLQDLLADLTSRLSPAGKRSLPIRISKHGAVWLRGLKYLILGVVLLASVGAIYPPLRDLCPARALFSFQLTRPLLVSVLITFVFTSLLNRRIWCKYLCPLGAVLSPFNMVAPLRLVKNHDGCTDCGRCDQACPMDIQDLPDHLRSPECIQCLDCQEACSQQHALEIRLG